MTGHNSIKMVELAALYNDLGLISPETYIQSGNVIFSTGEPVKAKDTAHAIERALNDKYGYDVPVMIRSVTEVKKILSSNPFLGEVNFDDARMAVIFLQDKVTEAQIQKVAHIDYPPDRFEIIGDEIYTFCPNGFGRTKIYTNFFENRMKVTGTARNWKTITTLFNLAEKRI